VILRRILFLILFLILYLDLKIKTTARRNRALRLSPQGFADFWQAYPRKVGKGAALKAYRKAAAECEAIKRALEWQADSADHLKRETKFIPYPATWLSQRRWEDPVPAGNGLDHDPGDY
jgi:hypothetical protein